jgi:hypothetical protein
MTMLEAVPSTTVRSWTNSRDAVALVTARLSMDAEEAWRMSAVTFVKSEFTAVRLVAYTLPSARMFGVVNRGISPSKWRPGLPASERFAKL